MKKIEVEADITWIDEELIELRKCPECKQEIDRFTVSIYEDSPHRCPKCLTKFVMIQSHTVYKIEEDKT